MYLKQIGLRATREHLWTKIKWPDSGSDCSWGTDIAIRLVDFVIDLLWIDDQALIN